MTVEQEVANLTSAINNLTDTVNVRKETLDAAVEDAEEAASRLTGTSETSVEIGAGEKSFVTQANRDFGPGRTLLITSDTNPTTHRMSGVVTTYDAETGALTLDVEVFQGSGSRADWTMRVSGVPGDEGPPGTNVTITVVDNDTDFDEATPAATELVVLYA